MRHVPARKQLRIIRYLDQHERLRVAAHALLLSCVVIGMMYVNDNVSDIYHIRFVQPYRLLWISALLKMVILFLQSPGPRGTVPWWAMHRWMRPLAAMLFVWLIPITAYFLLLDLDFSGWFTAKAWMYNAIRGVMWVISAIAAVVFLEFIWRWTIRAEDIA